MKVYFNNSCKICRSEINMYKKENIEDIDWIDITDNKEAEKEICWATAKNKDNPSWKRRTTRRSPFENEEKEHEI